jgi:hypothetical protein
MHCALSNPDVIHCIMAEVESEATLASLARVSKTLSAQALDRLWHTISSVVLLARCMPTQYWVEEALHSDYVPGRDPYKSHHPDFARQIVSNTLTTHSNN